MKRELLLILTAGSLLFTPTIAFAQTVTPTPRSATQAANQTAKVASIKTKAEALIDARLASLNEASTKINAAVKLSASDKSSFTSQVQADITSLTSLRAKIDADTDLVTIRTDSKTIFTDFRVYAVFLPQVHELATVDAMGVTADNLTTLATKLQARIQPAQQSWLTDMNTKIADAKAQYQAVETEILPLTPASYPGSKTTLQDARSKIKTGTADLRAALADAKKIIQALKLQKTASPSPTVASSSGIPAY